jgi:hypothetical protein
MAKLNQVVAIEKGVKGRVYGEITELHKSSQKGELFGGFVKTYRKKDEDGEDFPQEKKQVQMVGDAVLKRVASLESELMDVTAQKDWANCAAKANVQVDGQPLLHDVPVTYLLFLEKQITDLRTFIEKMPTLDTADNWTRDENTGIFKTEAIPTHRTKKVARPIVLYDATKEHPAQTQLIQEDITIGWWDTVKHSGALPVPRKQALLERIESLLKAIKFAREEANGADAAPIAVGQQIFEFILG